MFNHDGPLISTLKLEDSITDIVGKRIFPDRARERRKSPSPYVTYSHSTTPYYSHGGRNNLQNSIVHFYCIAPTDTIASHAIDKILEALESYINQTIGGTDNQTTIEFVKLLDLDGDVYDPEEGSDNYSFYRRIVVEIVWQHV